MEAELPAAAALAPLFLRGMVCLSPSAVPLYPGPRPVQNALLCGEPFVGVSVTDGAVGAPMSQRLLPVSPEETFSDVLPRVGDVGAELAVRALESFEAWRRRWFRPTFEFDLDEEPWRAAAPEIPERVRHLRFDELDREGLVNSWRALHGHGDAYAFLGGKRFVLWDVEPVDFEEQTADRLADVPGLDPEAAPAGTAVCAGPAEAPVLMGKATDGLWVTVRSVRADGSKRTIPVGQWLADPELSPAPGKGPRVLGTLE